MNGPRPFGPHAGLEVPVICGLESESSRSDHTWRRGVLLVQVLDDIGRFGHYYPCRLVVNEWDRIPRVATKILFCRVRWRRSLVETILPIGFCFGSLSAEFLRHWLDLVVLDPHSLVRKFLVVECITNGAAHRTISVMGCGYMRDGRTVYSVHNLCLHGQNSGRRRRRTEFRWT